MEIRSISEELDPNTLQFRDLHRFNLQNFASTIIFSLEATIL